MERQSRVHLDHPSIRGRVRTPQLARGRAQHQTDFDGRSTQPNPVQPKPANITPPPTNTTPAATKHPNTVAANVVPTSIAPAPTPTPTPVPSSVTLAPAKHQPTSHGKQSPILMIRTAPITGTSHDKAHMPRQSRSGVLRRQMVKASAKKYRPHKKRSYKFVFAGGIALFVLLLGSSAALLAYKKVHHDYVASAVLAKQTLAEKENTDDGTSSNDIPSEDNPPTSLNNYVVSGSLPRFLKIEKLGINARVRHVGPENDNGIKGPSNIYDVGWYENSSRPGENGTVLIDGHVAGQTNRGVFYGLGTIKKGDKIGIERGDGKKLSYTVVNIEQVDFDNLDMNKVMNSAVATKPGLNLMTASGRYNVRTNQYEKRVIVYAVQD